ncbi:32744_t:CDS:2, partial [Racocetra persica]
VVPRFLPAALKTVTDIQQERLNESKEKIKEDASSPLQKIKSVEHASNSPVHLSISERLAKHTPGPNSTKSNQSNSLDVKDDSTQGLPDEDPEKAAKFRENEAWSKALQKARAEKIKDDPKLLKKTIAKTQAEQQQKMTANIQARIDAKKNKKRKNLKVGFCNALTIELQTMDTQKNGKRHHYASDQEDTVFVHHFSIQSFLNGFLGRNLPKVHQKNRFKIPPPSNR